MLGIPRPMLEARIADTRSFTARVIDGSSRVGRDRGNDADAVALATAVGSLQQGHRRRTSQENHGSRVQLWLQRHIALQSRVQEGVRTVTKLAESALTPHR